MHYRRSTEVDTLLLVLSTTSESYLVFVYSCSIKENHLPNDNILRGLHRQELRMFLKPQLTIKDLNYRLNQ